MPQCGALESIFARSARHRARFIIQLSSARIRIF
jgi:hypothetical protein